MSASVMWWLTLGTLLSCACALKNRDVADPRSGADSAAWLLSWTLGAEHRSTLELPSAGGGWGAGLQLPEEQGDNYDW
jgi:hypothetical protein